jgi:ATP-dependent helicase HrpB
LTPLGEILRRFPLHPRLARVLVNAHGGDLAVRVCALLSEDVRNIGGGDALVLAESPRLDYAARELSRIAKQILGSDYRRDVDDAAVRRALLAGYPDRVAMRREPGSPRLLLSSGTGAIVREPSLLGGDFLVALDVSGGDEALVRVGSVVERDWLEPTHRDVVHALVSGRVRATARVWYGALPLGEHHVTPDPDEARRLKNADLRTRVDASLQQRLNFAAIDVDWDALIETTGDLQLPFDVRRRLDRDAPERLPLPSGRTTALDYRDDGSVVASVKLQELFGLAETPRLGPKKTPVTFALLSPAGRPVQVTRDLKSFWTTGYQEVRKELRARYPKHPWPEDPWTAVATHRTTKRR